MATSLPWHPLIPYTKSYIYYKQQRIAFSTRHVLTAKAFRRSDFDGFAKKVASGEAWKDAWRNANDGFEQLIYDAKKAAERIDREYSVSRRVSSIAESASIKARELDREFQIQQKWRSFSMDFSRNLPGYRKQLSDGLSTPLGKSFFTIFLLWFTFSGWLFRIMIIGTWVLPFAVPLLIRALASNFVIQGACPACKKQFVGNRNQIIQCTGCGNTVWQPKGRGGRGTTPSSTSEADIIDVEFEEK
ncbi:replicase polyprotein 1ab protein [Thalictrum thalictroides]|uniref:Replicase polyprotein 1ab protein n=1 Tax=Thalictrum thalictroides TaxID=46969 RepID=A0A7J6VX13_THATH|nr:replicase polyprotein 1ab protein [Thalictrum thalictroides]